MAEHRALLEQIARQAPLTEVLDGMARCIEQLAPQEVIVSVLLADPDGRHLRHGAAPSLPDFYNQAIDGIATGEGVGSCGTAAHRREPVIVGCAAPAEIKIADSWGDSAWGCSTHVEEVILNVRSVFIASEELGGLTAYVNR